MPETITAPSPSASVAGEGASSSPSITASPTAVEEPIGTPSGVETAEPEAGQEPVEPGTESDKQIDGEESLEAKEDGRILPKAIRALKETDPAAYKAEKARFYEHRDYKSAFPTVAEARKAKQSLDLVGGEAGLNQIQTDISDFKEVASQFLNGDPAFIDDLAETDPSAFGTHVPHMLEKYAEADRDGYNRVIAKQFSSEFASVHFRPALESAYVAIGEGKDDEARSILQSIAKWHDDVQAVAKREEDPRYKKLQEELKKTRESQSSEAQRTFHSEYTSKATKQIDAHAERFLDSYIKGRKLDADDRALLLQNIVKQADAAVNADSEFTQQRDRVYQRGDVDASVRFAVSRYEQALADATKKVMRTFSKLSSPSTTVPAKEAAPKNGAKPPAADGWVRVSGRPGPHEIDRNKTPAQMIFGQRAVLRDGRRVTWATT